MIRAALADLVLLSSGHGVLRMISLEEWPFGWLGGAAMSFLAGTALLGTVVTVLGVSGLPTSPLPWTGPILGVFALTGVVLFLRKRDSATRNGASVKEGALAVAIAAMGARLAEHAANRRVLGTDEYAIWFLKGRMLSFAGRLDHRMFLSDAYLYSHPDYPLLVPALIAWGDRWAGHPSDVVANVQAALLVVALFGVVGWLLHRLAGFIPAVAGLVTLAAIAALGTGFPALQIPGAVADVPLACFGVPFMLLLMASLHDEGRTYLRVAAVLAVGVSLTKTEGMIFVLAAFIAATAYAPRARLRVAATGIFAMIPSLVWVLFVRANGVSDVLLNGQTVRLGNVLEHLSRIPEIARFELHHWPGGVLPELLASIALVVAGVAGRVRAALFVATAWVLSVAGVSFIFIVTPLALVGHLRSSAYRVMMVPALTLPLAAVALMGMVWRGRRDDQAEAAQDPIRFAPTQPVPSLDG